MTRTTLRNGALLLLLATVLAHLPARSPALAIVGGAAIIVLAAVVLWSLHRISSSAFVRGSFAAVFSAILVGGANDVLRGVGSLCPPDSALGYAGQYAATLAPGMAALTGAVGLFALAMWFLTPPDPSPRA